MVRCLRPAEARRLLADSVLGVVLAYSCSVVGVVGGVVGVVGVVVGVVRNNCHKNY